MGESVSARPVVSQLSANLQHEPAQVPSRFVSVDMVPVNPQGSSPRIGAGGSRCTSPTLSCSVLMPELPVKMVAYRSASAGRGSTAETVLSHEIPQQAGHRSTQEPLSP